MQIALCVRISIGFFSSQLLLTMHRLDAIDDQLESVHLLKTMRDVRKSVLECERLAFNRDPLRHLTAMHPHLSRESPRTDIPESEMTTASPFAEYIDVR